MIKRTIKVLISNFLDKFIKNEQGISAIEYAIMSAGVATIVLLTFRGQSGAPLYDMLYATFLALQTKIGSVISAIIV